MIQYENKIKIIKIIKMAFQLLGLNFIFPKKSKFKSKIKIFLNDNQIQVSKKGYNFRYDNMYYSLRYLENNDMAIEVGKILSNPNLNQETSPIFYHFSGEDIILKGQTFNKYGFTIRIE